MSPFHSGWAFLHLLQPPQSGLHIPGCAALACQGAGNVQQSTKTPSGWVAAVPSELQRGAGKAAARARLWHNLSGQETPSKFL